MRIIVTGLIGQYPLGGVTWDYFQYVLGLARLGHEVYYIEDTGQWPYQPEKEGLSDDPTHTVEYIRALMARFDLADRWAYCYPWQRQWFGIDAARRNEVVATADLLINVSGTLASPETYRGAGRLVYIDSDPVFTQVKLVRGQSDFRSMVDAHDVLFSFGESFSESVPKTGDTWLPTRQPIVLDAWDPSAPHGEAFTTVMSWTSYKPIELEGRTYGQKKTEFQRFIDLPAQLPEVTFEIAANKGKAGKLPSDLLRHRGWQLADAAEISADIDSYRNYIQSSKAEWSIAKNGYVVGQSGWFSCRSACYLAAGRPVVVQETGFSRVLPVGEGLFAFATEAEAVEGVRAVVADYDRHAGAARRIAEDWFDSDKVLTALIERAVES